MKSSWILALAIVAGSVTACKNRLTATVDGVLLPECDSPEEPPPAPTLAILAEPNVPDEQLAFPAGAVRLAIERAVPWARVETLLEILAGKQIEPILLVGQTYRVRRFHLNDELTGAERFTITGDAQGKFCVQTALLPNAYCVRGAGRHIHRAFVRETVRDVVKKWGMREIEVYVDPAMEWADVVRVVDGARTCCGPKAGVRVRVARDAPLGDDAEQGNPALRRAAEEEAARQEAEAGAADEGATDEVGATEPGAVGDGEGVEGAAAPPAPGKPPATP
ncbi:MAG: hypothetical protein R3B48_09510 [Kofleriaceae bacterium]